MSTLTEHINQTERSAKRLRDQRNQAADRLAQLREAQGRGEDVGAQIMAVRAAKDALDRDLDDAMDKLRMYKSEQEADNQILLAQSQSYPTAAAQAREASAAGDHHFERAGQRAYDQVIRTGDTSEPRVYDPATSARGVSFFTDAWNYMRGSDGGARDRVERHAREVEHHGEMSQRATSTGSFAGLVVPQYLVEQAALLLRTGRPLASAVQHLQIPAQGMSLVIPRGTTGASAAVQASENAAVSSTDEVWGNLTLPVATVAGQQDVSRQSLERGAGVDQLIYRDLVAAYAAAVEAQVVNGTGASGQVLGIMNTSGIGAASAFGAAAGAANFNLKMAGANGAVYGAGWGLSPEAIVMHPRRWAWLTGLVDTTNRPVVQSSLAVAYNSMAVGGYGPADLADTAVVGLHSSGLPVIASLGIPTNVGTLNEDVVLSVDLDQLLLFEDGDGMPRQLSFEQTTGGSLTTKLVVYGYIAFTAGRYPQAVAKVGGVDTVAGNGLIAPTF